MKQKGIVFIAENFLVGLLGNPSKLNMAELEEAVKGLSSKPVKVVAKNKVSFKFKEKKATKEIVTSDIMQFMITGADMNVEKIVELLTSKGFAEME